MTELEDHVTVCVPVYNGGGFVEETLETIRRQTHSNFQVLISVDRSTDDSIDVCRSFLADSRFRLVEHERHLGWVDNANWLQERVETEYSFLLPHDDLIDESYIERLLAMAKAHPRAAVVYSDIQTFGLPTDTVLAQHSIHGTLLTRIVTYLMEHYNAVAWRGLMRLDALRAAARMDHNEVGDFAAETVWLFKIAKQGEFLRVAEPLYRKRYWAGSVHSRWMDHNRQERIRVWREHCLALAREALIGDFTSGVKLMILEALTQRLVRANPQMGPFCEISELSEKERNDQLTDFLSGLGEAIGPENARVLAAERRLREPP